MAEKNFGNRYEMNTFALEIYVISDFLFIEIGALNFHALFQSCSKMAAD